MPINTIPTNQMQQWVNDYSNNVSHPKETRNVILNLQDIKDLVTLCETNPNVNGIRLYFVRQNDYNVNGFRHEVFKDAQNNSQTQISLVAVPVINFQNNKFDDQGNFVPQAGTGLDMKDANGNYLGIYPQSPNHEHGGLCPPNCEASLNSANGLHVP